MPSRIIREGILTSLAVDRLSRGGELFYRRILNVVDDFGRYHGTPALLRAAAFPLKVDTVSNADIEVWIAECVAAGLVKHYSAGGLPYIEVGKFGEPRAKSSKYPAPTGHADACACLQTDANTCAQPQADASNRTVVVVESVSEVETTSVDSDESVGESESTKTSPAQERFEKFWAHYPRKSGPGSARSAFMRLKVADQLAAVEQAEAYRQAYDQAPDHRHKFFKHPTTWLNKRCWEDDHAEWALLIEGK